MNSDVSTINVVILSNAASLSRSLCRSVLDKLSSKIDNVTSSSAILSNEAAIIHCILNNITGEDKPIMPEGDHQPEPEPEQPAAEPEPKEEPVKEPAEEGASDAE